MGVDTINNKRLLERFEAHLSSSALAPATVVNYVADLRAFLRWSEGTNQADRSPLQLGCDDLQRYCSFLSEEKNHAPATINRRIQTLRKFYNFALSEGWVSINPAENVSLLDESASQRSRHLSEEDVSRLLDCVQTARPRWRERDRAIVHVFLGAGLKLSELTDLRVSDVHLDGAQPHLTVGGDVGLAGRTIPLDDVVFGALRRYLPVRRAAPGVDHLFVNRDGNPLSTRSVQRLLRSYAQEAHLEGLTTQALRYVYARRVFSDCRDLESVADLLGHRYTATTIRYLRPTESEPPSL